MVGTSGLAAGFESAFLYFRGEMIDLGTFGGYSSTARDINDRGEIAGRFDPFLPQGGARPFIYRRGQMTDLGIDSGNAWSINNTGQVVGMYLPTGRSADGYHAFLYSDGAVTDLGALGGSFSWGLSVNNSGQVVGYYLPPGLPDLTQNQRAFLYSGGVMYDLTGLVNNIGTTLRRAAGINAAGQIVADGADFRAYLLTPLRKR